MILDRLENAFRYALLHPAFADAFEWLRQADPATLAAGKHEKDGDRLFFVTFQKEGRGREAVKLETHRKYIDIQYTAAGCDEIGWSPASECRHPVAPFDVEKDAGLFTDTPKSWSVVPAGTLAIYFPEDAHAPMAGRGMIRKIIAKVAL